MPEEALCFVQFIHPGGEHRPDEPGLRTWNTGNHARKFLRTRGRWLDRGRERSGELCFWGEWEPPSRVEKLVTPVAGGPRYLHTPYLDTNAPTGAQNTDPFVFGERFLYTGCQQYRGGRPVQLRYLLPGSVILFGSARSDRFLLDTVFVVRDSRDHTRKDHRGELRGYVPHAYWSVTLGPWYSAPGDGRSWRLYRSASNRHPYAGMFGFFPALPATDAPSGFPRPYVDLPEITAGLRQGWRMTKLGSIREAERLWRAVRRQVLDQGLALGIRAEIPRMSRR